MKSGGRGTFLLLLLLLQAGPWARAGDAVFESGPGKVSLVELFSSEGCSSCPPADAWFSRLKQSKKLWKEFVPLVFHVNYWDRLGWKDVLAAPEFTQRQYRYADAGRVSGVYTPGVMLNGREWRHWGSVPVPAAEATKAGVLHVIAMDPDTYRVRYTPERQTDGGHTLNGALLGFGITHGIRSGENRGQTLAHDFVVRDWQQARMTYEGGSFIAVIELKRPENTEAGQLGAAFWITAAKDEFETVQAAGGWLD